MSRRRLFVPNESSPLINSSITSEEVTPNNSGRTPSVRSLEHGKTVCSVTTDETPKTTTDETPKTTTDETPRTTANETPKRPTDEIPKKTTDEIPKKTTETKPDSAASVGDSDSDSGDIADFFSVCHPKLSYSKEEDELILNYVLKGQNIFRVSSISLWKHLEAKKDNPKRTFQSLKNRFLRNIKPCMFSKYGYLIKDKTTRERIFLKFPELKQQVGRRDTLKRIKLPERKLKAAEEDRVSSTSANESVVNGERASPSPKSNSSDISEPAVCTEPTRSKSPFRLESETLSSVFFKPVTYERTVQTNKDGLIVCLDFKSEKCVANSFSDTSPGIYKTFQKLQQKNKLVFCPTCGRHNLPKKNTNSSRETDFLIPNSVETPKSTSQNSKTTSSSSKAKLNRQISRLRKMNFTTKNSVDSPTSPSLLGVTSQIRKPDEENQEIAQVAEVSNSQISRKNTVEVVGSNQKANPWKSLSPTEKPTKMNSSVKKGKRPRDSDTEFDSICEDAIKNFRKLVDFEEEKQLVGKCLNQNFKSIGLEACSEMNLDSCFLESSSDMEGTPPLTIDFDAGSNEKEDLFGGATESPPSRNLKQKGNKKP